MTCVSGILATKVSGATCDAVVDFVSNIGSLGSDSTVPEFVTEVTKLA